MKTVKQTAEIPYYCMEFSEKIVILPLVDKLAESIKNNANLNINIDKDAFPIFISAETANKICKILSNLGCRTSQGESYEDIVKSCNSQKEWHKIFFKNPGINKIQIIKILKEELNLGIKEAKDLADSYPTIIDLDAYKIERSKYLNILSLLEQAGAAVQILKEANN